MDEGTSRPVRTRTGPNYAFRCILTFYRRDHMKYSTLLWGLGSCMNFGAVIEYSIFQACQLFSVPVLRHLDPYCARGDAMSSIPTEADSFTMGSRIYSCHCDITQNFSEESSPFKRFPQSHPRTDRWVKRFSCTYHSATTGLSPLRCFSLDSPPRFNRSSQIDYVPWRVVLLYINSQSRSRLICSRSLLR
ncbi:hypothetical protein EDB83DRAFT_1918739 [Lactarius deliciosus]|nr:hypothetical protein EDB83DRAFT_1918739 [Lactarius deliciosus]